MIDIQAIVQDSVMQSLILSPLMGVIFAAIFSGLNRPITQEQATPVVRTRQIYRERVIVKYTKGTKSNDDATGMVWAFGLFICFISWKYATLYESVLFYLVIGTLTVISFSLTTIVISAIKGHFSSNDWWLYNLIPLLMLTACVYLIQLAYESFDPQLHDIALRSNVIEFYFKKLSHYGQFFMLTHVMGLIFMALALLLTMLQQFHYLSLMNQRASGFVGDTWFKLANMTRMCSGKKYLFVVAILLVFSYAGLEPSIAARWLANR